MSGGYFEYKQFQIDDIADEVKKVITQNGKEISDEEKNETIKYNGENYYDKYSEELFHHKYPDDVIEELKKGYYYLKMASIYTHRIDWLVSHDDGNEEFLKRLKEDIENFEMGR